MKKCPSCNFINTDDRSRCLRCKTALDPVQNLDSLPSPGTAPVASMQFGVAFRRFWRNFAALLADPLPENLSYRNPFFAGLISLFPGVGQIYNHQPKKAVLFLSGFAVFAALCIALFTNPFSNFFLFALLTLMLSSYADAFAAAARINGQEINGRWFLALMCWLFFLVGFGWSLMQVFFSAFAVLLLVVVFGLASVVIARLRFGNEAWSARLAIGLGITILLLVALAWIFPKFFFAGPIKAVAVTRDLSAPIFKRGDRIWVSGLPYWFHDPKIGDIVYYEAQWLDMEKPGGWMGGDYYGVRIDRHIERVVGLGGDTFERRGGVFFRNDKPVPAEEQPLVTEQLWENFKYTVPKDSYLILIGKLPDHDPITKQAIPALNSGVIVKNYEEVVFVGEERIIGRVFARYNPPARRKWF